MRRFVIIVLILAALAGAALFSWSRATSHPLNDEGVREMRVDEANQGMTLALDEDQPLVISLPGNPSTGYVWQVAEIDAGLLQQVGEVTYEPMADISSAPESIGEPVAIGAPQIIGAPAMMTLRFVARGAGESTLRLEYRRPWEQEQVERSYAVKVQARTAFNRTGWLEQFQAAPSIEAQPPAADEKAATLKQLAPLEQMEASALPSYFNWCDLGGCTPVRDQGNCGSCWAFATVGPLESLIKLSVGVNKNLAEQYLVSCNLDYYDCGGGWWVHDYHLWKFPDGEPDAGAVYEADYPYTATDSACSNSPHAHYEKISSWAYVTNSYSVPPVASIKQAIIDYGPVAVTLYTGSEFNNYKGGVFTTTQTGAVNHGVVLVGWDDSKGTNGAWRLRNSWGSGWGGEEYGYMWIEYGVSQVGYAATYVDYPMPPLAASSLDAAALSMHEIGLQWTDNSFNETGFRIERSLDGVGGWAVVDSVGANVTDYDDEGLSSGTTYYYRVQAYNTDGGATYTNVASAKPHISIVFIPSMLANFPLESFGLPISQDFESGVLPPTGWTHLQTNAEYTWEIYSDSTHEGSYAASVFYDPAPALQNEILLSPEFEAVSAILDFQSFGSVYWCRDTYDHCDLNVYLVVGDWGGGDDILVHVADDDWVTSYYWAPSQVDLTPYLPSGPVRLAFQYYGSDGAQVALDVVNVYVP